jgi:hypothetical protein
MIHRRDRIAHGNFLRRWLEQHTGRLQLEVRDEPPLQSSEILWDSQDARLRRAGFLLASQPRPGEAELWTIPLPEKGDPGLGRVIVTESWAETPGSLPPPWGDALRAILGDHSLQSILEGRAQFTPLLLVYHGEPLARLTVEQWILRAPEVEPVVFHAVETRTLEAGDLDLVPFFQSMSTACAMTPAAMLPEIDLLGAAGIAVDPELDLGPVSLDRTLSVGELGVRVLRRHFAQAWKNEPAACWGRDPEALHDFRVGLRRMRAALRIFRDFLPARIAALSVPLRTWMRATGEVRDLDVQLAQLAEWSTAIRVIAPH